MAIEKIPENEKMLVSLLKARLNELIDKVNGLEAASAAGGGAAQSSGDADTFPIHATMFLAKRASGTTSPYPWTEQVNNAGSIIDHPDGWTAPAGNSAAVWPDDSVFRFLLLTTQDGADIRAVMLPFLPKPADPANKDYMAVWNHSTQKWECWETKNCTPSGT